MILSNGCHKYLLSVVVAFVCLAINPGFVWAGEQYVARISEFKGGVIVARDSNAVVVATGTRLFNQDVIKTGADASVGIVFNDDTTLSLGPGSELIIQDYIFDPANSEFSFVMRLLRGTAAYASGLISKLSPESTRFITPSASIGIRGTRFVIEVDPV